MKVINGGRNALIDRIGQHILDDFGKPSRPESQKKLSEMAKRLDKKGQLSLVKTDVGFFRLGLSR
jgi:inhibitor of KinA sporulation pathway (predicted exonuclease)